MFVHHVENPEGTQNGIRLFDPQVRVVADVPPEEVDAYLTAHGLESEPSLRRKLQFPDDFRWVFPAVLLLYLTRIGHFPRVQFSTRQNPLDEYRDESDLFTEQQCLQQMSTKLNAALLKYSFVAYQSSLWEHESFSRLHWSEWVEEKLLPTLTDAEVVLPAGRYPNFCGAVFHRRGGIALADFLKTLPDMSWWDWSTKDEQKEFIF